METEKIEPTFVGENDDLEPKRNWTEKPQKNTVSI